MSEAFKLSSFEAILSPVILTPKHSKSENALIEFKAFVLSFIFDVLAWSAQADKNLRQIRNTKKAWNFMCFY